jgi:hypothetical protein
MKLPTASAYKSMDYTLDQIALAKKFVEDQIAIIRKYIPAFEVSADDRERMVGDVLRASFTRAHW